MHTNKHPHLKSGKRKDVGARTSRLQEEWCANSKITKRTHLVFCDLPVDTRVSHGRGFFGRKNEPICTGGTGAPNAPALPSPTCEGRFGQKSGWSLNSRKAESGLIRSNPGKKNLKNPSNTGRPMRDEHGNRPDACPTILLSVSSPPCAVKIFRHGI
jgi:hypothetical protein